MGLVAMSLTRWVGLILLSVTCLAHAEAPKQFLQCRVTENFFSMTHVIVLYSRVAIVDDIPFNLETNHDSYLLKAPPKIVADMLEPAAQIVINRITGEYLVLGRGVTKPESGICEKTNPKF